MWNSIMRFFFPDRRPKADRVTRAFQTRYARFKELLDSNSELSRLMVDVEEKLKGHQLYGMHYVRGQSGRAIYHTRRMIESLEAISDRKHVQLPETLARIENEIQSILGERREVGGSERVLPLQAITREWVDQVGSKAANLGELCNRVGVPVPGGFAITTRAFELFMSRNDLPSAIAEMMETDLAAPGAIASLSDQIRALITAAPVPEELSVPILEAYDQLVRSRFPASPENSLKVAVRSSALGEDGELSYAGQHDSILNVTREGLVAAFRDVVASLYSPWAMTYRLHRGVRDEELTMSVLCLEMVDAIAGGVVYSLQPEGGDPEAILVSAVWGLGPNAVDGNITPDLAIISRLAPRTVLDWKVAHKPTRLVSNAPGGLVEEEVPEILRDQPSVSEAQLLAIADIAMRLEAHFGAPQDIEWAVDRQGQIQVLQSRPLRVTRRSGRPRLAGQSDHRVLLEGGVAAFEGVGCGPVVFLEPEDDQSQFEDGSILVARHPSPRFVIAMQKASAIITDTGSPLGHMASLAREFEVPTLLDTRTATQALTAGEIVTVDAGEGRIYAGRVEALLTETAPRQAYMTGTDVSELLSRVADLILPLRLIDPRGPQFSPRHCRSLHDIMRFVHESSYSAMFRLSDVVSKHEGAAVKLEAPIPLDLYVIDLGGGLATSASGATRVTREQIVSIPFNALLDGMLDPAVRNVHQRPIELRGLLSVMTEQMLTPPGSGGERFGDRSYAIVSDRYVHFSSRIGYHYSILDSNCDEMSRKNYISFSFRGGAADPVRRGRRARAIGMVLEEQHFKVVHKGDRVQAQIKRGEPPVLLQLLEMLGRLLQFTRQLDMFMKDEESVRHVARAFLEGRYNLQPPPAPPGA